MFTGTLNADSAYIHYAEGYLIAPGYVDVSGLNFSATGGRSSYPVAHDDDNHGFAKGSGNSTLKNTILDDDGGHGGGRGIIRRRDRTLEGITLKSTTVRERTMNECQFAEHVEVTTDSFYVSVFYFEMI